MTSKSFSSFPPRSHCRFHWTTGYYRCSRCRTWISRNPDISIEISSISHIRYVSSPESTFRRFRGKKAAYRSTDHSAAADRTATMASLSERKKLKLMEKRLSKIEKIFSYFDKDKDGFWNFKEANNAALVAAFFEGEREGRAALRDT
eukprot:851156-Amorphochlora_amoeboformis.AAC.1